MCSVCGESVRAKGRCSTCYRFWVRHGRTIDRNMVRVRELRSARDTWAEEVRLVVSLAHASLTG